MNIYEWLRENAKDCPEKVCLKFRNHEVSYGEIARMTQALGTALRKTGVSRGDHVVIVLNNSIEFVVSYMAVVGIGAIVVPVNPSYSPRELKHILNDSAAKVLIIEKNKFSNYEKIRDDVSLEAVITSGEDGDFYSWVSGPAQDICEDMAADDVAAMVYSAGLTGYPMGAMLTHGNLDHNADLMRLCMNCGRDDTTLALIPCFHTFSTSVNLLSMLRYGGSIYMMKGMDFKELSHALSDGGVTAFGGVPTLFFGLVHHPDLQDVDYSRIHTMISGGAALPLDFYTAFKEKFGTDIRQGYGLTEASPVCAVNSKHVPIVPESIGPTVPGVDARVVDDDGNDVAPGEHGELLFRGPNVMKGYYGYERETADIIKDGWLYTGDLGYMNEDGYLFITGYKKEMIITSGFNVYCREVELALNSIPGVRDSAITGVPDLMRGAIVKAYIVRDKPELSEKDVKLAARKNLASFKTPREVVFVDEIPRDAKGKALIDKLEG